MRSQTSSSPSFCHPPRLHEGVLWVAHNKPTRLDLRAIFDEVEAYAGGDGASCGIGKLCVDGVPARLDIILQQPRFGGSPPFGDLVRDLFHLLAPLTFVNQDDGSGRVARGQDLSSVKRMHWRGWIGRGSMTRPRDNYPRILAMKTSGTQDRFSWFSSDWKSYSVSDEGFIEYMIQPSRANR